MKSQKLLCLFFVCFAILILATGCSNTKTEDVPVDESEVKQPAEKPVAEVETKPPKPKPKLDPEPKIDPASPFDTVEKETEKFEQVLEPSSKERVYNLLWQRRESISNIARGKQEDGSKDAALIRQMAWTILGELETRHGKIEPVVKGEIEENPPIEKIVPYKIDEDLNFGFPPGEEN